MRLSWGAETPKDETKDESSAALDHLHRVLTPRSALGRRLDFTPYGLSSALGRQRKHESVKSEPMRHQESIKVVEPS